MSVLAERSEKCQLELLRQYFNDKGVEVDKNGPENVPQNVKELIVAGSFIGDLPSEKDAEFLLNALLSLLILGEGDEAHDLVEKFCKLVTAENFQGHGWQSNAGVAVRVLSNLFHFEAGQSAELQFLVYKSLLTMCGRARLTNFIDVDLKTVEEHAQKWQLNTDKKREVIRLIHVALINDFRPDAAAEIMTALLRTYDDTDADKAKDDARECVRMVVIDPSTFIFDHLLQLTAVKRLEKTEPLIYGILKIFVQGRLQDYRAFVAKYPTFVKEQLKVENDAALEKKIKMLTLISMAESSQNIPLAKLKEALDIQDEEQLEKFIVEAIRMKAITGKINEVKQELIVTSFQHRIFERAQWELLQKKLVALLSNVKWANSRVHECITENDLGDEV